jgi:RNA polymerase sigma-70 factor (ECF subfamily)
VVTGTDADSWDWDAVRRWCRGVAVRCAGAQAADDIAQEAALRAWRRRDSCRDPARPWAWLSQITRNEAIRHAERQRDVPSEVPELAGAPEPAESVLPRLAMDDALSGLGELDRRLLRLHYELDVGVAALAQLCGLSPGAVRVRMHRARTTVRAAIEER